jgi:hypothetical protein
MGTHLSIATLSVMDTHLSIATLSVMDTHLSIATLSVMGTHLSIATLSVMGTNFIDCKSNNYIIDYHTRKKKLYMRSVFLTVIKKLYQVLNCLKVSINTVNHV